MPRIFDFLIQLVLVGLPPTRLLGFRRYALKLLGHSIGDRSIVCGHSWIYGRGRVFIGADSWISPGSKLYTTQNSSIEIGKNCDVGHLVCILTGSHLVGDSTRRAGVGIVNGVKIGDGVWIGARVTILPGCLIGEGSVVAAGSLVRTNVPSNTLVAGVPAKVIKKYE